MSPRKLGKKLEVGVRSGWPCFLWGPPGCAKTAGVYALRRLPDVAEVIVELVNVRSELDYGGGCVPQTDCLKQVPLEHFARLAERAMADPARLYIVFLDEFNRGRQSTQDACLRMVYERCIGLLEFPANVRFVLAGNPSSTDGTAGEIGTAMGNRACHWTIEYPTGPEWVEDFLRPEAEAGRIQPGVAGLLARYVSSIAPHNIAEEAGDYEGRSPMAFATPRSWHGLALMLGAGADPKDSEYACGLLGPAVGMAFTTWAADQDLPDPETLLSNPDAYVPDKMRVDRVFCTLDAVAAAVLAKRGPEFTARWNAAHRILEKAMAVGKDVIMPTIDRLGLPANRPATGMSKQALALNATLGKVFVEATK